MTDFILGVFEITIGMSLFIALLLIGLKLFGSKFTAKCRYIIWALVMIRLAIPFSFGLLPTLIEIPIDTELVQSEDLSSVLSENTDSVTSVQPSDPGDVVVTPTTPSTPVFPNVDTANPGSTPILPVTPTAPGDQAESVIPSNPVIETPTEQPVSLRQILDIAGIVYLTGAAIFLVWSLVSYFIYTRKILRSAKAADDRTQKIFSTICKKYGMKKQPTLLVASGIHSPAAFGIFRRKIVLPDIAFSENGLVGTLAHEVTHCKRGDLYMKLVELIACSLNWFNPLVHIAAFQCEMEMELSCDEKVLSGSSDAARAAYGEVMLDIIRRCRRNRGALTTHFNPKKSAVTARFKNILYGSGKRRGRILIGVCLVLCILAGAFVACQTGDDLTDDHWYAEGYYLKCDNGSDVIVMDADGANPASPCQMTPADDSVTFEGLTDGDRIKVEISMIMTTYPGQTEVYSIEKLSDGERNDIDSAVLDSLHELRWIEAKDENTLPDNFTEFYHEAEAVYALFTGYRSDIYSIGTFSENGAKYRSVDINGYTTLAELRAYCEQYFGSELTDELMSKTVSEEHPLYREHKGTLSRFDGYTAQIGYDVGQNYYMTLENVENGIYTVKIVATMTEGNRTIPATAYCTYTITEDGEIRFTSFELMAEKLFEALEQIPVEPAPFNPDAYAALIPNSSADRLFWHRIAGTDDYLYFCAIRRINSTMTSYTDDPPKDFAIYHINSSKMDALGYIEAKIPADIVYDTVCPVVAMDGSGSEKCEFVLQLTKGDETFYVSFANYDNIAEGNPLKFDFVGILGDDRVNELKAQYPDAFRKAEKFYWNFTLADFKNENPGNSFVYEGYTVEYECESPYGSTFDFHIHLPQLNSNALYAEKWNYIYQEYEVEFGDLLRKTVHGTNTDHYLNITYNTVTTGDVLTIYIIKSHGILASGAYTRDYDIFHYNMKTDRILSTNEFLAYYAEGQFADYTVTKIVEFMNQIHINADEMGNPLPLTEEDIIGVIPSVFGDGKFDVVYHGYSMEGYDATRLLFSAYPTYNHQYSYRLTYHDYLNCDEWKMYGQPTGYRLLLSQRVAGEFSAGYYVDCLFTEDIAEPPERYSLSEHGGYYTPVGEDPYGNMCIFIDHETAVGHLNTVIPFDMPTTAQDYYRGVHNKYFSYDRILNGTNYQVNQNIAVQVTEVLDAYRNGKDPNELFPASKTEYTSYPLEMIRENPTAEEIGEILKNTSVGESGIINFSIDLGDGWNMALPIDIGGFGESVQAYFTGVYFAHGTPKEEEDIEWTQYSETRTGEDGKIYQISFVLPVEWMHGSGGILNDANGKKRIGSRYIAVNRSKEDFVSSLEEMAEQYHVDLDSPLTGTSDSGISYMGYCFEGEREIPGDITGRYLYRFAYSDSISMHMDVWKRNAYDDDSFYEQYVLPIIQSVTIGVTGDYVDTITSLEDYKLLGPDFYESYYEYTRALIDGDTAKMEELSMYPKGTLDSYKDVRFTFKSITREAETGRFILTAEVSEGHVVIPSGTQQFYYCEYPRCALVPILEPPAPNATEASAELSKLLNMTMKFNLDEMEVTEYVIDCLYRKTGKTNFTENEIVEYAKKCFGVDSFTPNELFKRDGVYTSLAHGGNHIYHDVISTNYGYESGIYSVTVRFYADYAKTVYSHLIKYTMVKLDGDFSFLAQYIEEESPLKPFTHAT